MLLAHLFRAMFPFDGYPWGMLGGDYDYFL